MPGINEAVSELIQAQVAEGRQIGVQVCAYVDGKMVVDTWAGTMGPADARPVDADTLFMSFSTTKGVTATLLHMLADRGVIDYNAPVSKYWPEFGQNGKEGITVTQVATHQSGLHRMPSPFSVDALTDWDAGLRHIEQSAPAYEPGTAGGYHAFTFAWTVGGLIQKATGVHPRELFQSEIAKPLGVADGMYVGIPAGVEDRLATIEILNLGENMPIPEDAEFYKAMPKGIFPPFNTLAVRQACLPSANGHFTARALAKMYAALAGDGSVDGVRLVSPERLPEMNRLITEGVDVVIGVPIKRAIGFGLGGVANGIHGPLGPRETAFGHAGAGGSVAFADPEIGLSVAVTLNKMSAPAPGTGVTLEICDLIREQVARP